ncbi:MAG: hypothetical protein ACTSQY_04900 [Candidatus Odinarchaeia archaeon]
MRHKKLLFLLSFTFLLSFLIVTPVSMAATTWNGPIRLTNHLWDDYISRTGGSVAVDNQGRIHAVIYYDRNIYYIYDNNGYINETLVTTITNDPDNNRNYIAPVIAVDSNGLAHIVYYSYDGTDFEIYYVHSKPDGGFTDPIQLTYNTVADDYPQIVIDHNDVVHIVYQVGIKSETTQNIEIELKYINSTDYTTFSPPQTVIMPAYADVGFSQRLAVDSKNIVHLVYQASPKLLPVNYSIIYANNSNGSFDHFEQINVSIADFEPQIAIGPNDSVHIAFLANISQSLMYVNNSLGNFNISTPVKISSLPYMESPRLMVDNTSTVHFVMVGNSTTSSVLNLYYTNNATGSFTTETLIHSSELEQSFTNTVMDNNGSIHLIYLEGEFGDRDVYYLTTSSYYPVGVGPPFDPTFIIVIIGVIAAGVAVAAIILVYRKFTAAERELWSPDIEDEGKRESND